MLRATSSPHIATRVLLLLAPLLLLVLGGCADMGLTLTYGDQIATAVVQGCWEGAEHTPLPVTVTLPPSQGTAAAAVIRNPGDPTLTPTLSPTARPTTTPFPRCTPRPSTTEEPWPTPYPTEPSLPTREADRRQPVVDAETVVLQLPNNSLVIDLATHPVDNWPVVGVIDIPTQNHDAARVFARAYNPTRNTWGTGQTIDGDGSHPGRLFRSLAFGVTGNGEIHAVWGVTDYPKQEIFASMSRDYGQSWSAPERIADRMFSVLDVATTLDNHVFVLAVRALPDMRPVLLHREPNGEWAEVEELPLGPESIWYASGGALVVTGDGLPSGERHLVAVVTGGRFEDVFLLKRPFSGRAWTLGRRTVGDDLVGTARARTFVWRDGATMRSGVSVAFSMRAGAPSVYALTSLDDGATWGATEPVAVSNLSSEDLNFVLDAAPAYDPVARQLIVVWTCCRDAIWGKTENTHYASWRPLSTEGWTPSLRPETFSARIPLITGGRAVGHMALGHAANATVAWLGWIEDRNQVRVRTLSLDRVLPSRVYPTATPTSTPVQGRP